MVITKGKKREERIGGVHWKSEFFNDKFIEEDIVWSASKYVYKMEI